MNNFTSGKTVYFLVEHQNKQAECGNRRGKPKSGKTGRNPRSNWLPPTVKPRCRGPRVLVDYWTPKIVGKAYLGLSSGGSQTSKLSDDFASTVRHWEHLVEPRWSHPKSESEREERVSWGSTVSFRCMSPRMRMSHKATPRGFHHFVMTLLWSPSLWCRAVHLCRVLLLPRRETVLRGFPVLLCLSGNICRHLLPLIQCPTLIVHGEKDPLVPRFHADFLHKHVKGSRWVLLQLGNSWVPQSLWGSESSHRKEKKWEKWGLRVCVPHLVREWYLE